MDYSIGNHVLLIEPPEFDDGTRTAAVIIAVMRPARDPQWATYLVETPDGKRFECAGAWMVADAARG